MSQGGARLRLYQKAEASRWLRIMYSVRLRICVHVFIRLKKLKILSPQRALILSGWILGADVREAFNEQVRWFIPEMDLFDPTIDKEQK